MTLINELYELSCELPNVTTDVVNTNINFRAWVLNQWLADMSEDIKYGVEYETDYQVTT